MELATTPFNVGYPLWAGICVVMVALMIFPEGDILRFIGAVGYAVNFLYLPRFFERPTRFGGWVRNRFGDFN